MYGPVASRRLGRSLGIDPVAPKLCNWNCVYCQLGRTRPFTTRRAPFVQPDRVLAEVEEALARLGGAGTDWITFVGSGEPLLNSKIGEMIRGVRSLTTVPIAVITNGSLLSRRSIRQEVMEADALLPSLDAGSPDLYRRVNRPHPSLSYNAHLEGLRALREEYEGEILLEIMLLEGLNDSPEALGSLARRLEAIRPDEVHISVPVRPPAESWVRPAGQEGILRAAAILGRAARVLSPGGQPLRLESSDDAVETLLQVLRRHPLREDELEGALCLFAPGERKSVLDALEDSQEAQAVSRLGHRYWVSAGATFPDHPARRQAE